MKKKILIGCLGLMVLLLIAIAGLIIASGYAPTLFHMLELSLTQNSDEFSITIDDMVGGGFVGSTQRFIIKGNGYVYKISSPNYQTLPTTEIIGKADPQKLADLKNELGKVNFDKFQEGPQYSGHHWEVKLSGKTHDMYFVGLQDELENSRKLIYEILDAVDQ